MKPRLAHRHVPFLATLAVGLLLYSTASIAFASKNFFSLAVLVNFFTDNAVLGIVAIGMTFVILSGGIDLSVGAVAGLSGMLLGVLIQKHQISPQLGILFVLLFGFTFGAAMGALIRFFDLPAFLVTLAGMFLARGAAFMVRLESVAIDHPFYNRVSDFQITLTDDLGVPAVALVFLTVFLAALVAAHYTRFGRNVYAIGGNESSALLMGLPVGATRILTYALSGFCASLAGVVYTFYTFSGNPAACAALELDAIAAVVVGGTLLSGGVGYVAGTFVGVLIFGIIQTAITFQGSLSSWWTKIAVGFLLLLFILLQKGIQNGARKRSFTGGRLA